MITHVHLRYLTEFFLEREMLQIKNAVKIKTNILCSIHFSSENRVVYEIMWKNIVETDRPQTTT